MAVGLTLVAQGADYLGGLQQEGIWALAAGLVDVATGAALLLGVLTPFAGAVACLSGLGGVFSLLPASSHHLLGPGLPLVYVIVTTAAMVLLGPGAFSVDARLFGRREITIPAAPRRRR